MNEELKAAVNEAIEAIKKGELYSNYIKAYELMAKNEHIQNLLAEYKAHQKNLVNLEQVGKTDAIISAKQQLQAIENELEQIPLYTQYQQYEAELNQYLEQFSSLLLSELNI
ncbi:YlbF family regulator [Culicoidibacter larvae]|uniref:YlbF family regulator n=1 Tax=Culicoidibacter larvae TaxID=2579976 RepID=A0A5R8QAA0_9FIRM|nr:YlbF family regulator [Culicoidibacter larvae]TLG72026.1 hypothetical protein FEZ08_09340 [Culicoidibacter larvae]